MGRGTRDHAFRVGDSLVHRLQPASSGRETPFPIPFAFNCSLWIDGDAPSLDALLAAGQGASDGALVSVERVGDWTRPEDGRRSLCCRLAYRSTRLALTQAGMRALHARVSAGMVAALPSARMTLRTRANELVSEEARAINRKRDFPPA